MKNKINEKKEEKTNQIQENYHKYKEKKERKIIPMIANEELNCHPLSHTTSP